MSSGIESLAGPGEHGLPKYVRVKARLQRFISGQRLEVGTLLPSERELALQFGVSVITVKRALSDLAGEGVVKRTQGKGTFVGDPSLIASPVISTGSAPSAEHFSVLFLSCGQSVQRYAMMLDGIERSLSVQETPLLYSSVEAANTAEAARLRRLVERGKVKVILITAWVDDAMVRFAKSLGPPVILIGDYPVSETVSQACSDIYGGVRKAIEALLASGVKRIGLLNSARRYGAGVQISRAFETVVKEFGKQIDDSFVEWNDDPMDCAIHSHRILDRIEKPCGILAQGENAACVLRICQERGIAVPDDIRIIGFEASPLPNESVLALTNVVVDWGRELPPVIRSMIAQLVDQPVQYSIRCCLEARLMAGDTCAVGAQSESN